MADPETSNSSLEEDKDFDPSVDMLIHEYDDEQTLDEEEALSNEESVANEIDDLQREGDMPMEELLAMYGYRKNTEPKEGNHSQPDSTNTHENNQHSQFDSTSLPAEDPIDEADDDTQFDHDKNNTSLDDIIANAGILAEGLDLPSDEDDDYEPDLEDWKKTVQIGSDYQAAIPEIMTSINNIVCNSEDRILWNPEAISEKEVLSYLLEVKKINDAHFTNSSSSSQLPNHIRDDEQALYLLLQCDNNVEEALRRNKLQNHSSSDYLVGISEHSPNAYTMSLWSEEECRNFEAGLRSYGKDFFLNQQNKVKTRTVREIVQFYYLWKKTERHDAFAARTRQEKKKYALHPGITDYMDRFIDEYENATLEGHFEHASCDPKLLLSSKHDIKSTLYAHAAVDMSGLLIPPFTTKSVYLDDKDLRYEASSKYTALDFPLPTSELNISQAGDSLINNSNILNLDESVPMYGDKLIAAHSDISSTNNQLHFPLFDSNHMLHNLDTHLQNNDLANYAYSSSIDPSLIDEFPVSAAQTYVALLPSSISSATDATALSNFTKVQMTEISNDQNNFTNNPDGSSICNELYAAGEIVHNNGDALHLIEPRVISNKFNSCQGEAIHSCHGKASLEGHQTEESKSNHIDNHSSQDNKLRTNEEVKYSSTQTLADSTISL